MKFKLTSSVESVEHRITIVFEFEFNGKKYNGQITNVEPESGPPFDEHVLYDEAWKEIKEGNVYDCFTNTSYDDWNSLDTNETIEV